VRVNPTTYFQYEAGDEVCFDLDKEVEGWYAFVMMCGAIVLVAVGIIGSVWFIFFLLGWDNG